MAEAADALNEPGAVRAAVILLLEYITSSGARALLLWQEMNFTRIPIFLAPAFANATSLPVCLSIRAFSASACHEARHKNPRKGNRDSNKQRGVSAMRSTGLRHPLMAQKKYKTLPEPRDLKEQQTEAENDIPHSKNHGLLGFFEKSKDNVQVVLNTEVEEAVGRSWSIDELQFKSFNDLHALHWKCLYEMNRIKTRIREVGRLKTEDTRRATSRRFDWVSTFCSS